MTTKADYIIEMCDELSRMAQSEGLPMVAYLLALSVRATQEAQFDAAAANGGRSIEDTDLDQSVH